MLFSGKKKMENRKTGIVVGDRKEKWGGMYMNYFRKIKIRKRRGIREK
jgi:hypothetical protein